VDVSTISPRGARDDEVFSTGFAVPRDAPVTIEQQIALMTATAVCLVPAHTVAADHVSPLKPFLITGIDVHPENSQLLRNS
jgi:hypothetical protein